MDKKHVQIVSSKYSGSNFYNYEESHIPVHMAIANADY